jgi:4-hydroxy-3-methylbut-2-enyl diphosphate reductase IspH
MIAPFVTGDQEATAAASSQADDAGFGVHGVERAVETVERALEIHGAPNYVRKQIVHNTHVVRDLEARGARFVESETAVPMGERLVLAAHGVAPTVYRNAPPASCSRSTRPARW